MTLTPQQQLICEATQIYRVFRGNQGMLMAALIAYVAQLTGMPIDCPTLQANAAQYACLPPALMLPALIWLMANFQGGGNANPQVFTGVGSPVNVVAPAASSALYVDTSVPALWSWSNGVWQPVIE